MGCLGVKKIWGENMTKEEYIGKYINLNSKLFSPDDLTDENLKQHNKASRAIYKLCDELKENIDLAEKVYSELLENEDIDIQQGAATNCLELNIHIKKSVKILEHISKKGDGWFAAGAKRTLKIWRGEIGPYDPF